MSQILVNDQADLYKNAKEIITSDKYLLQQDDFELITVQKKTSPESIRKTFIRSDIEPIDKAMEKGSQAVRTFFNAAAIRKRRALEK